MDIDIIKDNTLVSSLTDVQFQISRPYNENGKTYATLTVMRKSGEVELIAKIKSTNAQRWKKSAEIMMNKERKQKNVCFYLATNGTLN